MKGKNKTDDCPLAPVGNYRRGYPNEEGHPVRTVLYVPPCPDWDGATGICHWFDPPRKLSEILAFIKRGQKSGYEEITTT